MNDSPGVPAALGIEAVECLQEDGNVIVRVTGRWRRRRPEWRGPPLLVIESDGMRHRFPALPEPPSLGGALPGTWRMSFSVAAELAPQLIGRAWLQLGSVVVPLPVFAEAKLRAVADEARAHRVARAAAPETLVARELRSAETGAQRARNRAVHVETGAAELSDQVEDLERALEEARLESEALEARLAEAEQRRRVAEQRAHAESAQLREAEEALAARARESEQAVSRAATLAERIHELEDEQRSLRRAADEAEHSVAGLRAARAVAERRLEELAAKQTRLAALMLLWPRTTTTTATAATASSQTPEVPADVAEAQRLLERERMARAAAERRADRLERVITSERRRWATAAEGIAEIRLELDQLRWAHTGFEAEPIPPAPPESAPAPATPALATPAPDARTEAPAAPPATPRAEPRALRQEPTPNEAELPAPPEPQSGQAVKSWVAPLFRALAATDPISAGRLVLALLPAQGLVTPATLAYDLILGDMACVQVTVRSGSTEVTFAEHPRPASQVQFQVRGDLAGLARLLTAGPLRRRFGRGVAKVQGDRSGPAALRKLIRASLSLRRLHLAGVRFDPGLGLLVCRHLIDPAWTIGERFAIAHQPPGARTAGMYLEVCDGHPPIASDRSPAVDPAATIVGPGEGLLPALAGARGEDLFVRGDPRPLGLVAQWLDRAQSA